MHSLIHEVYPELEYRFRCRVCQERFTRKVGLKKHMLTHSSIPNPRLKNYKCDVCERIFPKKKHLNYHLLAHMSDPNLECLYKCEVCGEKFLRKHSMKMHTFIHNSEFDPFDLAMDSTIYWFQCDVCKKKFMQKAGLRQHISKYHNNPLAYMFECVMSSAVDDEPLISTGASIRSPERSRETSETNSM